MHLSSKQNLHLPEAFHTAIEAIKADRSLPEEICVGLPFSRKSKRRVISTGTARSVLLEYSSITVSLTPLWGLRRAKKPCHNFSIWILASSASKPRGNESQFLVDIWAQRTFGAVEDLQVNQRRAIFNATPVL